MGAVPPVGSGAEPYLKLITVYKYDHNFAFISNFMLKYPEI